MKRLVLAAIAALVLATPADAQLTISQLPSKASILFGQNADGTYSAVKLDGSGNVQTAGTASASIAGFTPTAGAVANVSDIVNVSQDVVLPAGTDIVVTNKGAVDVNFRLQTGAGTAVATDQALKAGAAAGFHVLTATHLSVIAPTGTGTGSTAGQLNIQGGTGLVAGYGGGSSGGGGSNAAASATGSGVPSSGSYNAVNIGGTLRGQTGANPSGSVFAAQQDTTSVNGVTVLTGAGATGTGSQRVTAAQDTTTVAGAAPLTTGIYVTGPSAAALATAANQTTGNTSLSTIATNTTGAATGANVTETHGTVAAGTAATKSDLTGCVYNSTEPSPTTGQGLSTQCDSKGRQRQVIMDAAGNTRGVNVTAGNALTVDGSAVTQPTSHASGSVASGAYASGSIASGAYASGSIASGAFASGAISNGADVVEGNNTDSAACTSGTSLIACTRQIHADAIAAIPAGTNLIGKVGFDQTTPGTTNAVQNISGTTGGVTAFTLTAAASTNATNVKASAGTLYHIAVYNNSATLAWVSFYNTSGTPTCGTSIVYQTMIPANSTSGAGAVEDFATGMNFSSGIGICVTTGIAGTGSVAANSYVVGLGIK